MVIFLKKFIQIHHKHIFFTENKKHEKNIQIEKEILMKRGNGIHEVAVLILFCCAYSLSFRKSLYISFWCSVCMLS